jgi:hypothetical protein
VSRSTDSPGFDLVDAGIALELESETAQAFMLLGELRGLTRWTEEVLLRRVGCDPKRRAAATRGLREPRNEAETQEAMKHSLDYLGWLVQLASVVDLSEDRQRVVIAAYELCDGAGGPVADRVARCRDAFERPVDGWLGAWKLLQLGEVASAFQTAKRQLDAGPGRQDAERVARLTQPVAHLRQHIDPARLALLRGPDPERKLGVNVAAAMRLHCDRCTSCRSLAAIARAA